MQINKFIDLKYVVISNSNVELKIIIIMMIMMKMIKKGKPVING